MLFRSTEAPETDPIRPVPIEHVEAVLQHVSRQVAAMIQLQLLSGMRPGEVVLLRPCDVDRSGPTWVYQPAFHKTDYRDIERTIFFGPKSREILLPWLDRPSENYCFSPAEAMVERAAAKRAARKTKVTPSQAARRPKATPKRPARERYYRDRDRKSTR